MQHQLKDSDNPLTPLEGRLLGRIVLSYLEHGGPKNNKEIADEFFSEQKDKVLLSLNKIKLEGYIEEATNYSGRITGYLPTEKGRRWCDENIHNATNPFHIFG